MVALAKTITQSRWFQTLIISLIVLSGVISGVDSYVSQSGNSVLDGALTGIQEVILWVFVVEIALKILACGARPWRYFASGWNVFDFTIVAICVLPLDVRFTTVFRMARLLRTLRLVTILPRLQLLVGALLRAIPSLGYIGVLLGLHFYMFAITGTFLFRENDPIRFGTLHESFLTLFQVLTLEGWNDVHGTQYLGSDAAYDDAWKELAGSRRVSQAQPLVASAYFVSFILLGTMIMLNLFTGVIITSMEEATEEAKKKDAQRGPPPTVMTLRDELSRINRQLRELAEQMQELQEKLVQQPAPGGPGEVAEPLT
jgi:voltage-gated sodium channel